MPHSPSSSSSSEAEQISLPDPKNGYVDVPMYSGTEVRSIVAADREERHLAACNFCLGQAAEARATPPSLPIDFKQASEQGGWQLVPKEPTPEMLDAVMEPDKPGHYSVRVTRFGFSDAYRAMLDAAPSPHPEEGALLLGGDEGGKA